MTTMPVRLALAALLVLIGTSATATLTTTTPAPRTVVQADECPKPVAACAPIPPAPQGMTDEERRALGDVYTRAWNEVTR
ncbi:hypothetical protein [Mycobacteroides franklinii]|uniref:Secreted protein n=1 Tax=Mycobacteroides franklinii TaxID=948102 RepID=A0A4R5PEJ7_9MYCO|nr:hypothetical protein [Mycobacteroides franklinii]ORA54179.1 hypothetical protein BST24_26975 [Mycobacteroides franklinii]TDH23877.1 hypothetical protein EJ571_06465 [Mycobacteroides franklinii]